MKMIKKILPVVVFMLCCNGIVLNAQYSTRSFIDEESFIGGRPVDAKLVSHQFESSFDNNGILRSSSDLCPDGQLWDPEFEECYEPEDMDPDTPDTPGFPIGDTYGFWIVAAALYGLRCFYNRKRRTKAV